MPYTFRMIFTGLCAFKVREQDICAVLVDARDPTRSSQNTSGEVGDGHHHAAKGSAGAGHPSHAPVIQFFLDDLDARSSRRPDLGFRRPPGKREQGICFLNRDELSIQRRAEDTKGGLGDGPPIEATMPEMLDGLVEGTVRPRNALEESSLHWISSLGKLEASLAAQDQIFAPVPGESVVARLSLHGGAFGTQFVGRSSEGTPTIATFMNDAAVEHPSYGKQALAETVVYELRVEDDSPFIALNLKRFELQSMESLVFSFRGQPAGHAIQVFVKNMPLSDVLETSSLIIGTATDSNVDSHFGLYHELLEEPPKENWFPAWKEVKNGNPWCPPTLLP